MDNFGAFPKWGPYGKKYLGISRIVDEDMKAGIRFDFIASPTVFGRDAKVPNTTFMCGARAWHCNEDYSFFSYRLDLINRDDVYAVVSFVKLTDESTLVRTEIFNNTDVIQNCLVNYFSALEYRGQSSVEYTLPEKCVYINASHYNSYSYNIKRPWDEQMPDAMKKGVFPDDGFCDGEGLGDRCPKWHLPHRILLPFGGEKGDTVTYSVENNAKYNNPVLKVRYRSSAIHYEQGKQVGVRYVKSLDTASFMLNGKHVISFPPCDSLTEITFDIEAVPCEIELVSLGTGAVEFDFFAITEKEDADKIVISKKNHNTVPIISEEKTDTGYVARLTYNDNIGTYNIYTYDFNTRFRRINTGCLEDCLNVRLSNNDESFDDVTETFSRSFKRKHSDNGFYHNALVHTLFVKPHSSLVTYSAVSKGDVSFNPNEFENVYNIAAEQYEPYNLNKDGEKYALSNELLRSALLTNVVYPIYRYGKYIIHHTPGKRWDCLYTWDSGFIGLGLSDCARHFSEYILSVYLSDDKNPDFAFIHHGSPVPVQFYLYKELTDNDNTLCEKYYDSLKLYYDFYSGKCRGSTTAKFKSGLLSTYDYFYSSSGMDDYPAQVQMMKDNLRDKASPVITSAQCIRIAKIMLYYAKKLNKNEDISEYTHDIERLTVALNTYSWDEKTGYYSYVLHDENYEPVCKYTLPDGENLNKGLDGIYPIVASVCDNNQKSRILSHLKNDKELLSPYGISAVDMSAGYFKVNGYWNGNVWFSHQWFLFKTMLDLGEKDFAFEIASRALNIWNREVNLSYYTYEMVSVVTGRGGWFHNFGALSSPINKWANSYYKKGTVTCGFDTHIILSEFNKDCTGLHLVLEKETDEDSAVIICMNDEREYGIFSENEIICSKRHKGTYEISLLGGKNKYEIFVKFDKNLT